MDRYVNRICTPYIWKYGWPWVVTYITSHGTISPGAGLGAKYKVLDSYCCIGTKQTVLNSEDNGIKM